MPEVFSNSNGQVILPATASAVAPLPEGRGAVGPCCGIIAAWNALDVYYRRKNGFPLWLQIRKHEKSGAIDTVSMRQFAKVSGYTLIGELFYADRAVQLANDLAAVFNLPCRAEQAATDASSFLPTITQAVDAQRMVMVPFDVKGGGNGDPNLVGNKPHWALIFAYDRGKVYATHWGRFWEWDADLLQRSSACLKPWDPQVWEKSGKGNSWTRSIDKPHATEARSGASGTSQSASWGAGINLSESLGMKLVVI